MRQSQKINSCVETQPEAPRLQVKLLMGRDAIGPGKIELLRTIEAEGGISPAARRMGLSFRRAWYLIDTMNAALGHAVIESSAGGVGGGRSRLTPLGKDLVARYDALMADVKPAARRVLTWLEETQKS